MNDYLKVIRLISRQSRLFFPAVGLMLTASLFEVIQLGLIIPMVDIIFTHKTIVIPNQLPAFLADLINRVNGVDPQVLFWIFPVFLFGAMLIKNMVTFGHEYLMQAVTQCTARDIRNDLFAKVQSFSLDYFSRKRTGELISRITHDVNVIENAVIVGIADFFKQLFTAILLIVAAFAVFSSAAATIFVFILILAYPLKLIGKKLRGLARGAQERMADINASLVESISGIRLIKACLTEPYEIQRFKSLNSDYYRLKIKAFKRVILISPLIEIFGLLFVIGLYFWLGQRVFDGAISFGVFIFFVITIISLVKPIKKLGQVHALVHQANAAIDRFHELLRTQPTVSEKESKIELPKFRHQVELKNVSFHYQEESGVVLKDINLTISKGEFLAIVGPTGAGKTTLVNLIPRFYDPTQGAVFFDGTDVKDASFVSLRSQVGIVSQDTFLFNTSVRENLIYGCFDARDEDIKTAARRAFAHDFISRMPQGYDTVIGDRGARLSGGEKQRLSIARAILRNPPILVLDEATSQLDAESERFIQEALNDLMAGKTVIAIAHRLSTIRKADRIVVLEAGRVIGIGPHEHLMQTCPLYQKLHALQFQL